MVGQGGGGRVYRARNKIDGSIYAIKKVKLYRRDNEENERIKREVSVLSKVHNIHIVRYFNTWIEIVEDPREIKELGFSSDEDDDESFNLASDSLDSYGIQRQRSNSDTSSIL